jgi:hypothetical protein
MAETQKIEEILKDIDRKKIHLPEFQRPFVWGTKRIVSYIEALYKGDPTGNFLFWKTYADKTEKNYLVDGQQRITSLIWSLKNQKPDFYRGKDLKFMIYFNPFEETFLTRKPLDEGKFVIDLPTFFKKYEVNNYQQLANEHNEKFNNEGNVEKANQAINQLWGINYYEYFISKIQEERSLHDVVTIFNNLNSKGSRLSQGDLAYAQMSVIWPELKDRYLKYAEKIEKDGFKFDVYFYMRLLAVLMGKSALLDFEFKEITEKEVKTSWQSLEKILPVVLNMYRKELHIYNNKEILSNSTIYTTCAYLNSQPKFNFKNQKDISSWVWWTLLAGIHQRYSGSGGDTKINIDRAVVETESMPVKTLVRLIQEQSSNLDITKFRVRGSKATMSNAVTSTYVTMLKITGAQDWKSGTAFFPPKSGIQEINLHHIFPKYFKDELEDKGMTIDWIDNLPNRVVLTGKTNKEFSNKRPEVYLPEVNKNWKDSLTSQFVTMNKDLWKLESFDDFIDIRSHDIADAINKFINSYNISKIETGENEYYKSLLTKESQTVEWKESFAVPLSIDKPDDQIIPETKMKKIISKTVCSFANAEGGYLFIGVNDNGEVVGLEPDLRRIYEKLKDSLNLDSFELSKPILMDRLEMEIISSIKSDLSRSGSKNIGLNPDLKSYEENGKVCLICIVDKLPLPLVSLDGTVYMREGKQSNPQTDTEVIQIQEDKLK